MQPSPTARSKNSSSLRCRLRRSARSRHPSCPVRAMIRLHLKFKTALNAHDIVSAVDPLEAAIRREFPEIRRISIEARSFRSAPPTPPPYS